jgi:NAD(P)-dependent dehydrogenase (short-subunit alcohol dehydrogenase family)
VLAKAATDRLGVTWRTRLRPHGVTVVALYPAVRTERVLRLPPRPT